MSWFNENKFLAIFGGVVLVGAGFLGYMAMGASSKYDEAQTKFKDASDKLKGLYGAQTYPMDDNVKEYAARQQQIKGQIDQLQKVLSAMKIRIDTTADNITPNIFQDRLKETVAKVVGKAGEREDILPKDYYMGFERYKDKPPQSTAAAVALLKELRAIELVTDLLLSAKQVEIKKFSRDELKEENGRGEAATEKKGEKKEKKLVHKSSFSVDFVTTEAHFHDVVNGLAGNKEQLFVIRNLAVKNQALDAPPKVTPGPNGNPVPPPPPPKDGAGSPPEAGSDLQTIFGTENLQVTLSVDIVDVADPEVVVTTGKGATPAKPAADAKPATTGAKAASTTPSTAPTTPAAGNKKPN